MANGKIRKAMGREEFRLAHYAGEVNYNVNGEKTKYLLTSILPVLSVHSCSDISVISGFLDTNNDLLYRHLKEVQCVHSVRVMNVCVLLNLLCILLQVMCQSRNHTVSQCFHSEKLMDQRRPETVR